MLRTLSWSAVVIGSLLVPGREATAQAVELASRGPRFLSVSSHLEKPVDVRQVPVLLRRVTLNLTKVTLDAALDALATQAGLELAYSRAVAPIDRVVSLHAEGLTVVAALTELLVDADVDVAVAATGRMVLVRRGSAAGEGQLAAETGAIVGRVTDAKTQVALAGATVAVQGISRSAATGTDGRYRIANMAPGTYTVRARYIGYAPAAASVVVTAAGEATADFALERSAQRLDEVVTTGTLVPTEVKALPTPITVITAEDIERQHPRRFDELLRLAVPGAVAWEPAGDGGGPGSLDVRLRGTSSLLGNQNPKIYIDGIEVADRNAGIVDPQIVDRIEVVRGPQASALYGSDAMGGVIQIFTKRGTAGRRRPEFDAQAAVGRIQSDFQSALRQDYGVGVTGGGQGAGYRFGAGYTRTGDWMPGLLESTPSLHGALRLDQGSFKVEFSGRLQRVGFTPGLNTIIYATGGKGPVTPRPGLEDHNERLETYGARFDFQPRRWWRHALVIGVDRSSGSVIQNGPTLLVPSDTLLYWGQTETRKSSIAYHTSATVPLGSGVVATVTAGADHYAFNTNSVRTFGALVVDPVVRLAPGESFSDQSGATNNSGMFGQTQVSLRDAVFLTGSVRAENNSDFGQAFNWPLSPRVGVTYVRQVGGTTVKLRASYGNAIRPPSPGSRDSSYSDYGSFQVIQRANANLRPEEQSGPDGGVDLIFGRRGSLSVTHYDQTAKNFIWQVFSGPSPSGAYVIQWTNVARVKNTGWEFEGVLDLGRATLRGQYAISHSYPVDLGSAVGLAPIGEQFGLVPLRTGGLTLTATPLRRTTVTATAAYVGSRPGYDNIAYYRCIGGTGPCPAGFDFSITVPATAKVNVALDQELAPGLAGYVNVEDLLNNPGQRSVHSGAYWPLPGRIATVGVRMRW